MELQCRYCRRQFAKGEHLRRHERSHTGSKPFSCKDCNRSFARQDSLLRHERLHARPASSPLSPPLSSSGSTQRHVVAQQRRVQTTTVEERTLETDCPTPDPTEYHDGADGSAPPHPQPLYQQATALSRTLDSHEQPFGNLDFELIWPDSEDLFQSIISCDTTVPWAVGAGILPQTPISQTSDPSQTHAGMTANFVGTEQPSQTFEQRPPSVIGIPVGGNHRAVQDLSKMVASLSSSDSDAAKSASISSVFLDECLHMFFERFIPTLPVMHRSTFVFRDCTHPLLLNAIAIGSLYLGPKEARAKGEVLWRLAHTAVLTSWQILITYRGPYDTCNGVQLAMTALLGQLYGMLSNDRTIRTYSQAFQAMGFSWARSAGLLDVEPPTEPELPHPDASMAEKEYRWKAWAAAEVQKRAILALYMLDGLRAQMAGEPVSERHIANRLGLPTQETAFEAETAEDWLICMRSRTYTSTASFRVIFRRLFSPLNDGQNPFDGQMLSAFSVRVILEGLQAVISDQEGNDAEVAFGVPTKSDVCQALNRMFNEGIVRNRYLTNDERLESLLRWHAICLESIVKSSSLCRSLCQRYHTEQHIWTKASSAQPFSEDLMTWALSSDARRSLLHAAAIQDLVENLPRGRAHVTYMPSSLFAAATIYAVFSFAGLVTVRLPKKIDWSEALLWNPTREYAPSSGLETANFISGYSPDSSNTRTATARNLLYELHSMQKLFRCLATQWGIAFDMESVVSQWITTCHG